MKIYPDLKAIQNPTPEQLRDFAKGEEKTTSFGAPAYFTRQVSSRSAGSTFIAEENFKAGRSQKKASPELVRAAGEILQRAMPDYEWMVLDRVIGQNPEVTFHCRLLIPKQYARVALLWSQTLFPAPAELQNPKKEPDFLSVYLPQWPELAAQSGKDLPKRMILIHPNAGVTWILGTDYVGEAKMSFLRMSMYAMKRRGGLGFHAGSKVLRLLDPRSETNKNYGVLLFGLSGTGKTTLTLDNHDLKPPEGVIVLQDDITLVNMEGKAYGTENNFYVKTEGLTGEDQPGLYQALMNPGSVFENVYVDSKGSVDFTNYKHGTNGRALALRSKVPCTDHTINCDMAHKLIFITRRDTIVPPVARLTRDQAVAFFMLGESIETSAGDPTKAGQSKHEVGFNPFILGLEDEEGNRLGDFLTRNAEVEVYLLNTGSMGKGADAPGKDPKGVKITKSESSRLIELVSRPGQSGVRWVKDPDWGYEVPETGARPRDFYQEKTYQNLVRQLKEERRTTLSRFTELDPEVLQVFS